MIEEPLLELFPVVRKLQGHLRFEGLNTNYKVGDKVQLPCRDTPFEVTQTVRSGSKGAVYQLRHDAEFFALKMPILGESRIVQEFQEEVDRDLELRRLGFASAEVIWHDADHVLKRWISGELAGSWYDRWIEAGCSLMDEGFLQLYAMAELAAKHGVFLDGLNPENLIWSNREWVIVDSKKILEHTLTPRQSIAEFVFYLNRRWGGPLAQILWNHWQEHQP